MTGAWQVFLVRPDRYSRSTSDVDPAPQVERWELARLLEPAPQGWVAGGRWEWHQERFDSREAAQARADELNAEGAAPVSKRVHDQQSGEAA